jgi:hypothetical protein
MLLRKFFKSILLCLGIVISIPSFAVVSKSYTLYLSNGYTATGPADAIPFAEVVQNWGIPSRAQLCSDSSLKYDVGRIDYVSLLPFTGRTFKASASHYIVYLFDIGFNGVAFSPTYLGTFMNKGTIENTTNSVQRSVPEGTQTVWEGNISNSNRGSSFNWGYGAYLYKDAIRLPSGVFNVPAQPMYQFNCYDTSGTLQETIIFNMSPFNISSSTTSCTPNQTSAIIQMTEIPLSKIEEATLGTLIETQSRGFSITCPKGINVFVSVTDLVDPSNYGSIVTKLTADSTAKGVGYIVSSPGAPTGWALSPPGSTPGIPGLTQYYLGESTVDGTNLNLNMRFSYTKTENQVSEGTAKSIVGITYSYQ